MNDPEFWASKKLLGHAMDGPGRLLRLLDGELYRAMPLQQYYTSKCHEKLIAMEERLNDSFFTKDDPRWKGSVYDRMDRFLGSNSASWKPKNQKRLPTGKIVAVEPPPGYESEDESEDDEEDDDDEVCSADVVLSDKVGTNIVKLFEKRMEALLHDGARCARLCSPCKEVMEDVDHGNNVSEEDWQAVERVLRKTMVPEMSNLVDQQREENRIISTFKKEFLNFCAKRGCYSRPGMFDDDMVMSRPDEWHHINSVGRTEVFGIFAVRCCSMPGGIGACERGWKEMKRILGGHRARLSAASAGKQATIYGAQCASEARARRKKAVRLKATWEIFDDNALGFNERGEPLHSVATAQADPCRKFFLFVQDWEVKTITVKTRDSEMLLSSKYGGVCYYSVDKKGFQWYKICRDELKFSLAKGKTGWCVQGYPEGNFDCNKKDIEKWVINNELLFMIKAYYRRHDPSVSSLEMVTKQQWENTDVEDPDYADIDEWIRNEGRFDNQRAATKSTKRPPFPKASSAGAPASSRRHLPSSSAGGRSTRSKRAAPTVQSTLDTFGDSSKRARKETPKEQLQRKRRELKELEKKIQEDSESSESSSSDESIAVPKSRKTVDGGVIEDSEDSDSDDDETTVGNKD